MTRSTALLLVVSIAALAACHVTRGSSADQDNVRVKADGNGQVSFDLPFAKGTMKLPQGAVDNSHFDIDGVKMVPGGTIHGFSMDGGDNGATVRLAFNAPKSPEEVRSYFADQLKNKGDEVTQSTTAVSGETRDGDSFVIDVKPEASGSSGTIVIRSKD